MGLILAMLCGCGQRQSVSAEKETDRIVIWTWDDTFNVKAAKLAAKEYKKTHKDIQIIVETKEREEVSSVPRETDFMESRLTAEQQHFFTGSIF